MKSKIELIHFAEDGDTSGFFPALAKYHDRSAYTMTFATLKAMSPSLRTIMQDQGVETFSTSAKSRLQYPIAVLRLARLFQAHKCQVAHTHLFDPSVVGLTAARLAGVPTRILTRHYSNYHTRIGKSLHVKLDQWCTALSSHVIAVSNETAEHLIRVEGAPRERVTAIHNGIDFERVKVSNADARQRIRKELGLGDGLVFLTAARLHPEKGYENLFAAIRVLKTQGTTPFTALVAGRGPFLDEYQSRVRSLDIADRVRFLGFRSDLPDLMVASDAFVLPSVAEAFGLVLAEALYLGVPVIASRVGGIPEIVDDQVDGLLVAPGDPTELAEAMGAFLNGSPQLPGRGDAAIKKVRDRFDFQKMLKAYEAVYVKGLRPK